jgi:hypothetical protein
MSKALSLLVAVAVFAPLAAAAAYQAALIVA